MICLRDVGVIYTGWDFSFYQLGIFFLNGLRWQIWFPSKCRPVPLICSNGRGGWTGDKLTAPFCCPSSWGFSRTALAWSRGCCLHGDKSLQLHQLYPARSSCELTSFKKQNIERKYTVSFLTLLWRLVKHNPNMAHWLLTRIMAREYALNSCSAGEKLMEGVFGSVLSLCTERERGGPRGMDGAAVIVNSRCVYVSANSLRKETGDILHTVLQARSGPLN